MSTPEKAWWQRDMPEATSNEDLEYDASLDVDPGDDYDRYTQADLDYFSDQAADRYERDVLGL